jgi:hypothetical protein
MVGSLFAALLFVAPEAPPPADAAPAPTTTEAPATPDASTRDYQGPTAVQAPESDTGPALIGTSEPVAKPEDKGPATLTATTATPTDPTLGFPVEHRRMTPRALETIEKFADDEVAVVQKRRVKFYPGIQVRNQVGYVSPFTIDRFGNEYAEGGFSTGRIRWNPVLEIRKKIKLVGMLDLVNGRWAPSGSEDPIIDEIIERGKPPGRTTLPIADPRELYLEWRFGLGLLRVGQQAFTWGQGILANNGNYQDRFGDLRFGDDGPGDIYERILFATKPFRYRPGWVKDLAIAIGGDLVYRDERVRLVDHDIAGQAILVVRWQPEREPWNYLGGYAVYRNQKTSSDNDVYPDDNDLEVGAFDVAGQGVHWTKGGLQLIGAFEGALIVGRTTIARDENGTHKVLQGGAAARGYVGHDESWLVGFDAGYASGDPDPTDRWINNFTFDAGHTVGLVLFNQVNAWRSARTEMLATDGDLTGVPLNGTQFIPTRGGATNAIYIHPKARYAVWERLEVWGGPLFAAAPVPIVDPYTTRLNGGVPTNTVEGDGNRRYYGTEIDVGIRGRFDIRNLWLQAGVQGGLLVPGPGLANRASDTDGPVGAVWFRTEIRY